MSGRAIGGRGPALHPPHPGNKTADVGGRRFGSGGGSGRLSGGSGRVRWRFGSVGFSGGGSGQSGSGRSGVGLDRSGLRVRSVQWGVAGGESSKKATCPVVGFGRFIGSWVAAVQTKETQSGLS